MTETTNTHRLYANVSGVYSNGKKEKWRAFLTIQDKKFKYSHVYKTAWLETRQEAIAERDRVLPKIVLEYFEYVTAKWQQKDEYYREIVVSQMSEAEQAVYRFLRDKGDEDMIQFSREDLFNDLDIPARTYRQVTSALEYMQIVKIKKCHEVWFAYFK